MGLLRYEEYISESAMFQMILESKLVFSGKILGLLHSMRKNKIAKHLIGINRVDVQGIVQNYIDVTDNKDQVSFTPDRKVQEVIKDRPDLYKIVDSGRYLTHSDRNNRIFERLGYVKEGSVWVPPVGTLGTILKETMSVTGNTYCLFQEFDPENPSAEGRKSVINKTAMASENEPEVARLWSTSRNPIAVGRLVRAILKATDFQFTDPELEEFVNLYKSTFDISKNAMMQFDIVSGKDIQKWYDGDRYVSGGGTLNNSCMSAAESEWLAIYTKNPQVRMVILYSQNGEVVDGKYTATEIRGRAIVWDCEINGNKCHFMDRIYTAKDSDIELFKEYAQKNGFWYKVAQNYITDESVTDGNSVTRKPKIVCKLDDADPTGCYPYIDTLPYINVELNLAGNSISVVDPNEEPHKIREARSTEGEWYSVD